MQLDPLTPTAETGRSGSPADDGAQPAKETQQKFVSFYVGETLYAVQASAVSEVTAALEATPLPDAPVDLAGIAHLRGEIVALVDLQKYAEGSERAVTVDKRKAVVLKSSAPGDEMPLAFNVDRLGEIVSLGYSDIVQAVSKDQLSEFEANSGGRNFRIIESTKFTSLLASDK